MAAKYGVMLMCTSKQRAETLAKLVREDGYGALVVKNTGPDSKEYPYLVRRTNRPLKKIQEPKYQGRGSKLPSLKR